MTPENYMKFKMGTVNEVLLGCSHVCLFTGCLWLRWLRSCDSSWPTKPEIFPIWPFREKVCQSAVWRFHERDCSVQVARPPAVPWRILGGLPGAMLRAKPLHQPPWKEVIPQQISELSAAPKTGEEQPSLLAKGVSWWNGLDQLLSNLSFTNVLNTH